MLISSIVNSKGSAWISSEAKYVSVVRCCALVCQQVNRSIFQFSHLLWAKSNKICKELRILVLKFDVLYLLCLVISSNSFMVEHAVLILYSLVEVDWHC